MREQLGEMKTKLLSELDSELRAGREANKDEGMDTYDLASEERDREINFILSDRERVKIKQVDDALGRLDDGTYGVCESCGLEIAEERLLALPFTRSMPRLSAGSGKRGQVAAPLRRRAQHLSQARIDRRGRRESC